MFERTIKVGKMIVRRKSVLIQTRFIVAQPCLPSPRSFFSRPAPLPETICCPGHSHRVCKHEGRGEGGGGLASLVRGYEGAAEMARGGREGLIFVLGCRRRDRVQKSCGFLSPRAISPESAARLFYYRVSTWGLFGLKTRARHIVSAR